MTSSPSLLANGRQLGSLELVISHCPLYPVKLSTEFCMAKEASEIRLETGLPDVRRVDIPRKKVKEAAMYYSLAEVKKEMNSVRYKKLDMINHLDCRETIV